MKKIAALFVAIPLLAAAQESAPPPPQYQPPPPPQYAPPAPPAHAPNAKVRDSWYIGFGLGGGTGSLERGGGRLSFKEYLFDLDPTTVSINLKVGATLSPKLLLGFDGSAVRSQVSSGGDNAALQISNYDVVATFFPMEKGLFFRAGAGLSRFSYDEEIGGFSFSTGTTGVNAIGGVGYAFWLGQKFNLTLNVDLSAASYGDQNDPDGILPESSRYASFWVGFDWY